MIIHLITAVENIEEAILHTADREERQELQSAEATLRRVLRRHGCFIGSQFPARAAGDKQTNNPGRDDAAPGTTKGSDA